MPVGCAQHKTASLPNLSPRLARPFRHRNACMDMPGPGSTFRGQTILLQHKYRKIKNIALVKPSTKRLTAPPWRLTPCATARSDNRSVSAPGTGPMPGHGDRIPCRRTSRGHLDRPTRFAVPATRFLWDTTGCTIDPGLPFFLQGAETGPPNTLRQWAEDVRPDGWHRQAPKTPLAAATRYSSAWGGRATRGNSLPLSCCPQFREILWDHGLAATKPIY